MEKLPTDHLSSNSTANSPMNMLATATTKQQTEAKQAIVEMMIALKMKAEDAKVQVSLYLFACQTNPIEAIREAARRFIAGLVEEQNKTWPPTTAEFAAEVRRIADPPKSGEQVAREKAAEEIERTRLETERFDRSPTEESKARVQAMVDKFKAERKAEDDAAKAARLAEEHEQNMARIAKIRSETGQYASPALLRHLEEQDEFKSKMAEMGIDV